MAGSFRSNALFPPYCLAILLGLAFQITGNTAGPIIIGHRGSPKYVPEHTLASFSMAMRESVDFVEPDLVLTKDGQLVCIHDLELSSVTDVASKPEFADRKTTISLPNKTTHTGWFVHMSSEAFTLAELKTLRIKQRVESRDNVFNGFFQIATLDEAIELVQSRNLRFNTSVGLFIEIKHTGFYEQLQMFYEDKLLETLARYGYPLTGPGAKNAPIFIQCFESAALKRLRPKTSLRLIQLIEDPSFIREDTGTTFGEMVTKDGLDDIAVYADGIGPWKRYFYSFDTQWISALPEGTLHGKALVNEAHQRRLVVHTWTVRNKYEDAALNSTFEGSAYQEQLHLFLLGIDGVFTESATEGVQARKDFYVLANENLLQNNLPIAFIVVFAIGLMSGVWFTNSSYERQKQKTK